MNRFGMHPVIVDVAVAVLLQHMCERKCTERRRYHKIEATFKITAECIELNFYLWPRASETIKMCNLLPFCTTAYLIIDKTAEVSEHNEHIIDRYRRDKCAENERYLEFICFMCFFLYVSVVE